MAYESLATKTTGDRFTLDDWDAIDGNLAYLLNPNAETDTVGSANTTSTSYVDTGLSVSLTSSGGLCKIQFHATCRSAGASGNGGYFAIYVDGVEKRVTGRLENTAQTYLFSGVSLYWDEVLSAGDHTIAVKFKAYSGSNAFYVSNGYLNAVGG